MCYNKSMLIRKKLEQILGSKLEHPVREEWGDYSVFAESPEEAEKLIKQIKQSELNKLIEQIEVVGKGFINIRLKVEYLISQMFPVLNKKTGRVMVEYSSPNIAKTFGIGHLRSTIIGQALYNIYKSLGYEVIGDNHLGDWGTQFGKLLYMLDREKLNAQGATLCVEDLEKLYVRYHKISEDDKQARKWFKRLEDGDKLARKLWEKCVQISVREFARIYKLLKEKELASIKEAYESLMQEVVADAKTIARKSQGALVIDIPGHPPLMLLKSDGGTTYATRDLATLKFRKDKWDPDLIIYEVGAEQTLHFQQVFAAARMLGYVREGCSLIHTKHGLYLAENGKKFRTRTGSTVNLEEVLREAITRARNNPAVGIGAIKYFDLSHNVQSDIVFDWEKVMVLQGNSGPYLQYTYARAQSVLVRAKGQGLRAKNLAPSTKHLALNEEELAVLRWIYRWPEVVEEAGEKLAPNLICNFIYELAQRFNTFYNKHRILNITPFDPPLKLRGGNPALPAGRPKGEGDIGSRDFRLALTEAVGQVLKMGLEMLGIKALEHM